MKKYVTILMIVITSANTAMAQSLYTDYALQLSQNIYEGTARFQGMGGAFAALGGDVTTLSINPAGIGVYRSSEITFTPMISITSTSTDYMNIRQQDSKASFGLGNVGFVSVFPTFNTTGLKYINFGISFNKIQNNKQYFSAMGISGGWSYPRYLAESLQNRNVLNSEFEKFANDSEWLAKKSGLIEPIRNRDGKYIAITEDYDPGNPNNIILMGELNHSYFQKRSGYVGEYAFSAGANFSDNFYIGATIGLQNIDDEYYSEYQESPVRISEFSATNFHSLTHVYEHEVSGAGGNFKVGAIFRPVDGLRLGAYFHTPTWMLLSEHTYESMSSVIGNNKNTQNIERDYGDRKITTPFKWGIGLAYTGKMGLVSFDYEGVNFSSLSLNTGSPIEDADDNRYLRRECRTTTNIRAGAELRIDEIAVRAGYSYYQNPVKGERETHIGSVGIGYRGQFFYIDAAYSFIPSTKQSFNISGDPENMVTDMFSSKIALTIGCRF